MVNIGIGSQLWVFNKLSVYVNNFWLWYNYLKWTCYWAFALLLWWLLWCTLMVTKQWVIVDAYEMNMNTLNIQFSHSLVKIYGITDHLLERTILILNWHGIYSKGQWVHIRLYIIPCIYVYINMYNLDRIANLNIKINFNYEKIKLLSNMARNNPFSRIFAKNSST